MDKSKDSELQISADQILKDAYDHRDPDVKHIDYKITDAEELKDYQSRIRSSYEKALQFKRTDLPQYVRYAKWECTLHNYARARSIFERALQVDHGNVKVWYSYISTEIETGNINHARNLLERAISILPRVDKFYYEYIQLEEKLGSFGNCHGIFKRWLNWKPEAKIFNNYIKFLIKYKDYDEARLVFENLIKKIPTTENFFKFIDFEIKHGSNESVVSLFDLIIQNLISVQKLNPEILSRYARYESDQKRHDKARQILKFGIDQGFVKLIDELTTLEKQQGTKDTIEESILLKRKLKYEFELEEILTSKGTPDISLVWDYLDLLQELNQLDDAKFESVLSKCQSNGSDSEYMIWLRYLYFLELVMTDVEKTRQSYRKATKIFTKRESLWVKFANFEIRQDSLAQARKIYGYCLAKLDKPFEVLESYVSMELSLRQFDRVRKIFESYLAKHGDDLNVWLKFVEFESQLDEVERCGSIFQIMVDLFRDEKVVVIKYLEFLHGSLQFDKTRQVYRDLLAGAKTKDKAQIWIAFALNELKIPSDEQQEKLRDETVDDEDLEFEISGEQISKADRVFQSALDAYKKLGEPGVGDRVVIYEAYKSFIKNYIPERYDSVLAEGPSVVKVINGDREELKLVFKDPIAEKAKGLSFLENAKRWMQGQSK